MPINPPATLTKSSASFLHSSHRKASSTRGENAENKKGLHASSVQAKSDLLASRVTGRVQANLAKSADLSASSVQATSDLPASRVQAKSADLSASSVHVKPRCEIGELTSEIPMTRMCLPKPGHCVPAVPVETENCFPLELLCSSWSILAPYYHNNIGDVKMDASWHVECEDICESAHQSVESSFERVFDEDWLVSPVDFPNPKTACTIFCSDGED
jgi:hypothetical protein